MLEHILFRLKFLNIPSVRTVIATSVSEMDNVVEQFCIENGIDCFRGSENDVLDRYFLCSEQFAFDDIVRLTADNPLTDVEELSRLIRAHVEGSYSYSASTSALPIGVGAEVFSAGALRESHIKGAEPHHREHVNEYILENPETFKCFRLHVPDFKLRPEVRLTIDTDADFRRISYIIENSPFDFITTEEAIALSEKYHGEN